MSKFRNWRKNIACQVESCLLKLRDALKAGEKRVFTTENGYFFESQFWKIKIAFVSDDAEDQEGDFQNCEIFNPTT